MIITPDFVWTHMAKTGGYSVHRMISLVGDENIQLDPLGGEWSDYRRHEPFWMRSEKCGYDITANKIKVLTIRRLPAWILSFGEFKKREEGFEFDLQELSKGYFKHEKRDMVSGGLSDPGSYDTHHADEALAYYRPETIDHWWKQESLNEDVVCFLGRFYTLTPLQIKQMSCSHENSNEYDRNLGKRFSQRQLEELYHNCPLWSTYEQKVYGSLLV
ncbi:hypothetical protein [Marinoscillum sp. 108]|uniref:Sulfotransferase domain-containing protein n=1 Tax=Marinoscillum luteum TaxID=861051 RepID=A0ABW7NDP2_9BACT|nr:hypothetical protein [Marinoscillum sp. 108]VXD13893.1 conserved hypothetical protein [Marinoscillum sp. 108]